MILTFSLEILHHKTLHEVHYREDTTSCSYTKSAHTLLPSAQMHDTCTHIPFLSRKTKKDLWPFNWWHPHIAIRCHSHAAFCKLFEMEVLPCQWEDRSTGFFKKEKKDLFFAWGCTSKVTLKVLVFPWRDLPNFVAVHTVVKTTSTFSQAEKTNAVPRYQDLFVQLVKFKGFRQEIFFPLQKPCFTFKINLWAIILWNNLQCSAFPFNQIAIPIIHTEPVLESAWLLIMSV